MQRVAEVIINLPTKNITKPFSYLVPDEIDELAPGWRVLVPFGSRKIEGFVASVGQGDGSGLKPILSALDEETWFTPHMLAVAEWVSNFYICTIAEAMRLFIPGKTGIKSRVVYRAIAEKRAELAQRSNIEGQIYEYLVVKGPQSLAKLTGQFGTTTAKTVRRLCAGELLARDTVVSRTAKAQYQTYWYLVDPAAAVQMINNKLKKKPAQQRMVETLLNESRITADDLRRFKISRDTVKALMKSGIINAGQTRVLRDSYQQMQTGTADFRLAGTQRAVLDEIIPAITKRESKSYLLHGITGSGKTQVYIEAATATRQDGRQVVVLVPEIALTGQIVERFKQRFCNDVVVLHSKLSAGERFDTWQRLASGEAGIVIGARSAVFAPVVDPGLFILDEEHEFTYKQEESPHYHAREVALKRAELSGAQVILGSATPAVETYYDALQGKHKLLAMPERVDGAFLPEVTVVDMRDELKDGKRSVISQPLKELLIATLERKEQAIILLNRRGYSTFVLCRECGHVMKCSHCEVSLVYHHTSNGSVLRCHYCQARQPVPDVCPACRSRYIKYFGTGTQKVEEALAEILPGARIVRMDQDTTSGRTAHQRILTAFATGEYDILLGTQMVAKGHDIKNVTAVGIISADTALNLPDFRAAEKTFALLTQAAGRAGRGNKPGRVVVQTYNADHYAIIAGSNHDYAAFYAQEIELRRELDYPPYSRIVKFTVQGTDEIKARRLAEDTAAKLRTLKLDGTVIGPFPAPVAKISEIYRMHILLKTTDIEAAVAAVRAAELDQKAGIVVDVDPLNVL
ncbi:MAG: primosomal protein [Firmicutes bacterium]|nr:primosomal protein [Bacillota bacterium]